MLHHRQADAGQRAGIREPQQADMRNNPPVTRGLESSRQRQPEAPPRRPLNHMYLSPVQSRPHSTVLSYSAVQPANAGSLCREENARFMTAIGHFTASNSS